MGLKLLIEIMFLCGFSVRGDCQRATAPSWGSHAPRCTANPIRMRINAVVRLRGSRGAGVASCVLAARLPENVPTRALLSSRVMRRVGTNAYPTCVASFDRGWRCWGCVTARGESRIIVSNRRPASSPAHRCSSAASVVPAARPAPGPATKRRYSPAAIGDTPFTVNPLDPSPI